MKCTICGKACTAESDTSHGTKRAVSSCCKADIAYVWKQDVDYTKDAWQGHRHNVPPHVTGAAGYTRIEISLRDYFAAKAMQGLVREIEILDRYFDQAEIHTREDITRSISEIAYDYADAMLKEREK